MIKDASGRKATFIVYAPLGESTRIVTLKVLGLELAQWYCSKQWYEMTAYGRAVTFLSSGGCVHPYVALRLLHQPFA